MTVDGERLEGPRRSARPRPLSDAVRSVRERAEPLTLLAATQAGWLEAVGARIGAEATPTAERDGVVTVACRAATWAEELDLLHDELLERLNSVLSEGTVRALRFTATPPPG